MSTTYLKSRKFNKSLRNMAMWGYWTNASVYMPGTDRENAPWFEVLTDETGWAWFIPHHNGTTSVGVVLSEQSYRQKREQAYQLADSHGNLNSLKTHYMNQLRLVPGIMKLLLSGSFSDQELKTAGDYSYSSTIYAGKNWRIAGDAGAFVDPFFSSGVHLAFTGGLSAASTIAASIREQCSDIESATFHNQKIGTAYTRFLLVALSIYTHIRSQQLPVLSDIDEDNFDRAFHILRPVIQGCTDVDPALTLEEILSAMEFCRNIVNPTQPEMLDSVSKRFLTLYSSDGPILSVEQINALTQINETEVDEEARNVLLKENSRKIINPSYDGTSQFSTEVLGGFWVIVKRGQLGLVRAQ